MKARRVRRGRVGYAPGIWDMFHVGHLNLLRRAHLSCDYLIAGVVPDLEAVRGKGRLPVVSEAERWEIVDSIDVVDETIIEPAGGKPAAWDLLGYHVLFKGDDWQNTPKGVELERDIARCQVDVVYLPYTDHTSSTRLRELHRLDGPHEI